MASSKEYLDFVLEQLAKLNGITYRAMMGEYVLYYRGKVFGGIYDDRFLVKPVPSAVKMMPDALREPPYAGAKEMLLVDNLDDREFLRDLLNAMSDELPEPKKKGKPMIETKRLKIYPASSEQMETLIAAERNDELRAAYTEMLEGSLAYPDQREWYAIWMIELKDGTHIGDLCFKGLIDGVAEIGYGISEEYQNQGYATEAVGAVVNWALKQSGVTRIEAETEPDNNASRRVLEKCGFIPTGRIGEEGPRFVYRGAL